MNPTGNRFDANLLAANLLAEMTLEEKIGQLTMVAAGDVVTGPIRAGEVADAIRAGRVGNLLNLWGAEQVRAMQAIAVEESRLKIPLLIGFDVLHGHRTIFPIPLAEAALFDPHLWERSARASAIEAASDGISLAFAPMLDIARDPRWGRIAEGPGEDPWVAATFATAKVRGLQGASLAAVDAVAATAKHFCGYGAGLAGLDYASADISERLLHEVYLPPFKAAVAAGCAAIMPSFNDVNGVPMTAHIPLLRDWLRREQGFEGVIVSDYFAIAELMRHGVAADLVEAAAAALAAGVDIDMMSDAYRLGLPAALERGVASMSQIDAAVRRVLALKARLGLFDDPLRRGCTASSGPLDAKARRDLARDVARRAIVVLTNKRVSPNRKILPLAAGLRRIALIGPLADNSADMLGPWAAVGTPGQAVTVRQGLEAALPNAEIVCACGVGIEDEDISGIAGALELCRGADVVLLCLGESATMSGEAACRANPVLPGRQWALAQAVLDLGKPVVALIFSGRPLMIPALVEKADAVVAAWFLGIEAGNAVADVLSGHFNPTGRLPITWPREIGQVPIFFAARPSGRPAYPGNRYTSIYLDLPVEPQFPFGHGLSYNDATLTNLRASAKEFKLGDELVVLVDVANLGPVAGEETVFLFARDVVASIARPHLELKGFGKIALQAGESATLSLPLRADQLCFPGPDLRPRFEPGDFELSVGASADPLRLLTITVRALPG
ncbi:glycoside hydrolase family 3 N-terminal domain-containing protein [Methylocapsa aurea]|uniref:glycoside hydrolase family 3 N-terminal domain-containing protein n=1 Tax=Methylocapsa aurea TaxID=663610 RepID=UPI00068E0369|nr:glycoside hydrolase family 3 N-terminal domain-containing protein [Methylocapsa aurea]